MMQKRSSGPGPRFWLLAQEPYYSKVWLFKTNRISGRGHYRSQQQNPSGVTVRMAMKGEWRVAMCGREMRAKPGDIFLSLPGEPVDFEQTVPNAAWEWSEIQLSGPEAPNFVAEFGLSRLRPVSTPRQPSEAKKLFRRIHSFIASQDRDETGMLALCLSLAAACGRAPEASHEGMQAKGEGLVKRAKTLVETDPDCMATVKELAGRLGVDRTTLGRAFKAHAGCSPHSFIDEYRLARAKELLQASEMRLDEIGRASGFPDVRYFISWFKAKEGRSPGKWRRSP